MKLANAVVLITGANRGFGLSLARQALARGARKVYAAARDPSTVTLAGVVPIRIDVTSDADIAAAVALCSDVTIVINNAGIADFGGFLADGAVASARKHLETNYFGVLAMSRAFAPVLAANGGGALVNVLSVASWINRPMLGVYGSTKSAAWGLTNGLRNELRAQKTQVLGVHVGFMDTDLARDVTFPKTSPDLVAARTFDALEAGQEEVLADEITRSVHAGLSAEPSVYLDTPVLAIVA